MKVCLPFRSSGTGGPSVFAQKFRRSLEARGITTNSELTADCDIVLVIVGASLRLLLRAKALRIPVVQRLDGLFYRAISGPGSFWYNRRLWSTYRFFSDGLVFQSEYSQRLCRHFLGQRKKPTTVIYNGVDLQRFAPASKRQQPSSGPLLLALLTRFDHNSGLKPLIEAFDAVKRRRIGTQLSIVGELDSRLVQASTDRPDIAWIGKVPHAQLPEMYRRANIMISAKLRNNCPNAVLEALASGLPVACFDSGGHLELVGRQAGICVPVDNDGFGPFPPVNAGALAEACERILDDQANYVANARQRAMTQFGLEKMTDNYLAFFESVLSSGLA